MESCVRHDFNMVFTHVRIHAYNQVVEIFTVENFSMHGIVTGMYQNLRFHCVLNSVFLFCQCPGIVFVQLGMGAKNAGMFYAKCSCTLFAKAQNCLQDLVLYDHCTQTIKRLLIDVGANR